MANKDLKSCILYDFSLGNVRSTAGVDLVVFQGSPFPVIVDFGY